MNTKTIKLLLITGFLLTGFFGGAIAQHIAPGEDLASSDIPIMIVGVTFIFFWYYIDSNEHNYGRSPFLNISIIVLAVISMPYYLFRSRGVKGGFVGLSIFVALIIGYWLLDIGGRWATYYVLQS